MSDPQSLAQSGAAGVAPIVDSTPSPSAGARAAASGDSFDKVAAASSAAATFDSGFISSASVGFSSADLSAEQQPQSSAADDNCRQPIASSSSSSSVRAAEQPPQKSAPFIDSGLCDAADEEPSSTDSSMHLDKQSAAKEWTCTGPQLDGRNNLSTVSTPSDDGTKQRHAAACKTDVADAFILKQYRSLWKMIFLQDSNGDTQLHLAVDGKMTKAVLNMIRLAPHSELLDLINDDGQTAMHCAVYTGQPQVVRQLRAAGAKPSIRDFCGNTPLHVACQQDDAACVEALTSPITVDEQLLFPYAQRIPLLPADPNQLNYDGEYCVHIAAQHSNITILRTLAACHGIDMNAREACGGYTALHQACESGDAAVRQFLLAQCRHQLDLETPSYGRQTAYQFAAAAADAAAMQALRDSGAVALPAPDADSDDTDSDSMSDDDGSDDEAEPRFAQPSGGAIMVQ